jgi:hypothetical protein
MNLVRACALMALAAWLLALSPSAAPAASIDPPFYALITPPSKLEIGCQGPCACPIIDSPTYGSFELVRTGADPLYTYYDVQRYIASFNNGPGAVALTGSGHYKIGGEVALMQELTLDLEIEGQPPVHLDSGLKPVTVPFPQIDIACAAHGFYCHDTVLVVDAKPIEPTSAPLPPRLSAGLQGARPNPFEHETTIAFRLDRERAVDLTVVDAGGRTVRVLASGQTFGAGPQAVAWDGRRDDGRVASPGVYWARLRWAGGADRRRIVKLD